MLALQKKPGKRCLPLHLMSKIKHSTGKKYFNPNQKNQVKWMVIWFWIKLNFCFIILLYAP
jgi:Mn2+/Fe2+ NRAMP family transporter